MKKDRFLLVLLVLLAPYPFLFKMDFSRFHGGYFDILELLPPAAWFYLVVLYSTLVAYCMLAKSSSRARYAIISFVFFLTTSVLFFPLQFPTVSSWEYLNYAGLVTQIESTHRIVPYYTYSNYPGVFFIFFFLSLITDAGTLASMTIVAAAGQVATFLFILLISYRILGSDGVFAVLLWVLTIFAEGAYARSSPAPPMITLTILLGILLLLIRPYLRRTSATSGLLMVLTMMVTSLVISHPATSILADLTILTLYLRGPRVGERGPKVIAVWSVLIAFCLTTAWLLYTASPVLLELLTLQEGYRTGMYSVTALTTAPPDIISVYRRGFFLLTGILGLFGLILYLRGKEIRFLVRYLFALLLFAVFIVAFRQDYEDRIWFYAWPVVCLAAAFSLSFLSHTMSKLRRLKTVKTALCGAILLSLLVASFIAVHSSGLRYEYQNFPQSWETQSAIFSASYKLTKPSAPGLPKCSSLGTDYVSIIIFRYYAGESVGGGAVGLGTGGFDVKNVITTFLKQEQMVRSIRLELEARPSGYNSSSFVLVDQVLTQKTAVDRVYDSRYTQIYFNSQPMPW